MPTKPLPIPKGFRRLNDFALDPSGIFPTWEALQDYASENPTAYPGQTCAVVDGDSVELYVLNASKVPVIASGSGDSASSLTKALASRQKILTGETAPATTLQLIENLAGYVFYHRPQLANLPGKKGWITHVSNVSNATTEENLDFQDDTDFVFAPDRQCFYFCESLAVGTIAKFTGAATQNFINFMVDCQKTLPATAAGVSTCINTAAQNFQITSVSVKSDSTVETPHNFYFDNATSTILFESAFTSYSPSYFLRRTTTATFYIGRGGETFGPYTGEAIKKFYEDQVLSATDYFFSDGVWTPLSEFAFDQVGSQFQETDLGAYTAYQIQQSLSAGTLLPTDFFSNGEVWKPLSEFSFIDNSSVKARFLTTSGEEVEVSLPGLQASSRISVPKNIVANQNLVSCLSVEVKFTDYEFTKIPVFALEKTPETFADVLHLGWTYPTIGSAGLFTVNAQLANQQSPPTETFEFRFSNAPSNLIELPRQLENVASFSVKKPTETLFSDKLIVFDETRQRLIFPRGRSGSIAYTATHLGYTGLAAGGEELEILEEIPGVFATTAGTGHALSTLRTFTPTRDLYSYWKKIKNRDFVQILDDKGTVLYADEGPEALFYSRPGYTAPDIQPVTPKLPLACLYPLSPRNDESFFHVAFTPDFLSAKFASSTYSDLDDTQRYATDSIAPGKQITLSTNKTATRGLQGAQFAGPKPTFYAGKTIPKITLSTYKWFIVKCKNTNGNGKLAQNAKYLLCVNNVHYDTRAILVNITSEGYNVAADLFAF